MLFLGPATGRRTVSNLTRIVRQKTRTSLVREWKLLHKKVRRSLVSSNFSKSHCAGAISVLFAATGCCVEVSTFVTTLRRTWVGYLTLDDCFSCDAPVGRSHEDDFNQSDQYRRNPNPVPKRRTERMLMKKSVRLALCSRWPRS